MGVPPRHAARSNGPRRCATQAHAPLTPLPTIAGTTRVNSGPTTVGPRGRIGGGGGGGSEGERVRGRGGVVGRGRAFSSAASEERSKGGQARGGGVKGDISRVRRAKCVSVVTSGIRGGAVPWPAQRDERAGFLHVRVRVRGGVCSCARTCVRVRAHHTRAHARVCTRAIKAAAVHT